MGMSKEMKDNIKYIKNKIKEGKEISIELFAEKSIDHVLSSSTFYVPEARYSIKTKYSILLEYIKMELLGEWHLKNPTYKATSFGTMHNINDEVDKFFKYLRDDVEFEIQRSEKRNDFYEYFEEKRKEMEVIITSSLYDLRYLSYRKLQFEAATSFELAKYITYSISSFKQGRKLELIRLLSEVDNLKIIQARYDYVDYFIEAFKYGFKSLRKAENEITYINEQVIPYLLINTKELIDVTLSEEEKKQLFIKELIQDSGSLFKNRFSTKSKKSIDGFDNVIEEIYSFRYYKHPFKNNLFTDCEEIKLCKDKQDLRYIISCSVDNWISKAKKIPKLDRVALENYLEGLLVGGYLQSIEEKVTLNDICRNINNTSSCENCTDENCGGSGVSNKYNAKLYHFYKSNLSEVIYDKKYKVNLDRKKLNKIVFPKSELENFVFQYENKKKNSSIKNFQKINYKSLKEYVDEQYKNISDNELSEVSKQFIERDQCFELRKFICKSINTIKDKKDREFLLGALALICLIPEVVSRKNYVKSMIESYRKDKYSIGCLMEEIFELTYVGIPLMKNYIRDILCFLIEQDINIYEMYKESKNALTYIIREDYSNEYKISTIEKEGEFRTTDFNTLSKYIQCFIVQNQSKIQQEYYKKIISINEQIQEQVKKPIKIIGEDTKSNKEIEESVIQIKKMKLRELDDNFLKRLNEIIKDIINQLFAKDIG